MTHNQIKSFSGCFETGIQWIARGKKTEQKNVPDALACQEICKQSSKCRNFYFKSDVKLCALYEEEGEFRVINMRQKTHFTKEWIYGPKTCPKGLDICDVFKK